MNVDYLLHIAPVFALSCTPVSWLLIRGVSSFFPGYKTNLSKVTAVCTTDASALIKEAMSLRTLVFDKYKLTVHSETDFLLLENTENNDEKKMKKSELCEKNTILYMAATTSLCRYYKTRNIEGILSDFFISCGLGESKIKEQYEIVAKIPAIDGKKFSSIVAMDKSSKEIFSFAKGQAGILLKRCNRMVLNGKNVELDNTERKKLRNKIKKLHKSGQKSVAFAYKPLPLKRLDHYSDTFVENDMVLLGIAGMGEVPNADIAPVVEELKGMGIKNYILSSGKKEKTIAIGQQLGITSTKYFEGFDSEDLAGMNDEQLSKVLSNKEKDHIFFRLTEEDKKRVLKALKKNGENVVINKKEKGKNMIKLLDGIKKERNKKSNYGKILLHSFSCKMAEILLFFTAIFLQAPLALTAVTILAVDLTVNLVLELGILAETDYKKTRRDFGNLFVTGVFGGIFISFLYVWGLIGSGWTMGEKISEISAFLAVSAMVFVLLCLFQILNAYNLNDTKKSLFVSNPLKTPYLSATAVIAVFAVYIAIRYETPRSFLRIEEMPFAYWQIVFFGLFLILLIEEIRKYAK